MRSNCCHPVAQNSRNAFSALTRAIVFMHAQPTYTRYAHFLLFVRNGINNRKNAQSRTFRCLPLDILQLFQCSFLTALLSSLPRSSFACLSESGPVNLVFDYSVHDRCNFQTIFTRSRLTFCSHFYHFYGPNR